MSVSKALLHNDGRKSDEAQAKRMKTIEAATSVNEKRGKTCTELTAVRLWGIQRGEPRGGGGAGSRAAAHGLYAGSGSSAPPLGLRRESRSGFSCGAATRC